MPIWLQIVVAVVGAIGTICGILGITAYISERQKHRASKKNQAEDEAEAKKLEEQRKLEEMRHQEYVTELKTIIGDALLPVANKLTDIENDLGLVKRGVQVTCRNDLEELADKADKQGYLSRYDKDRFESAYLAYHNLGKNGVMDATYTRIMGMNEIKPAAKKKTRVVDKK